MAVKAIRTNLLAQSASGYPWRTPKVSGGDEVSFNIIGEAELIQRCFDSPYMACNVCNAWVIAHLPMCANGHIHMYPCFHAEGCTSACPTWEPIVGCGCDAAVMIDGPNAIHVSTRHPAPAVLHPLQVRKGTVTL